MYLPSESVYYEVVCSKSETLYHYALESGTLSRLTRSPGEEEEPTFSPDGRRMLVMAMPRGEEPCEGEIQMEAIGEAYQAQRVGYRFQVRQGPSGIAAGEAGTAK